MISWLALPYYALFCCVLFSSTTGIATIRNQINTVYTCPGTEVVFTCVVNTTMLSWDIDFLSSPDIDRVVYLPNDPVGHLLRASSRGQLETWYHFNLTSKTPFTSTMTTVASADLHGSTLSCRDGIATGSVHADTLVVEIMPESQVPSNVTAVMPLIHPNDNTIGSLNITLEWDVESDPIHLGHNNQISNYTVAVYPDTANSESIFYTADTSIPLALNYDQDYNISVVASNCVGNSTPAEIHIRLVHCGSSVGKDIDVSSSIRGNRKASKLKTYCLHSSQPGLVPVFTPAAGEIKPDKPTPANNYYHVKNGTDSTPVILIPVLIASHLLLSLSTLVVGLLLGCLLSRRCCGRARRSSKTVDKKFASFVDEPVYSEKPPKVVPSVYHVSELVKSVDNVTYGRVNSP